METVENTNVETEAPVSKAGKIRTSITIRPEFKEKAKLSGKSLSAVVDSALAAFFNA